MEILFIENREKTRFWDRVSALLAARGVDVSWIVQNPFFSPTNGARHQLRFPPKGRAEGGLADFPVVSTDRGRQYFHSGSAHYADYADQIGAVISRRRPDLVVGESTLFHELLAIDACRREGVPFAHPTGNRYPAGRISIYRGDSQEPLAKSGEKLAWDQAVERARAIAEGREQPFYMAAPGAWGRRWRRAKWAVTRGRVWAGRLRGERYNTPSLVRKYALSQQSARNQRRWSELASLPRRDLTILYPLQMQPEANIDVWGRPFSDQVAVLETLLAAAPHDVAVAVKANPKSKYEISDELLALAERDQRLVLLPFGTGMAEAQRLTVGSVTVSGTVGLEAVFGRGRCISLRHPVIDVHFPMLAAADPGEAVRRLLDDPEAGKGSIEAGARLLQILVASSFPGFVGDPLTSPHCLAAANVALVADAIMACLPAEAGKRAAE